MRILLVEDDAMIGESLLEGLQGEGYVVDWVSDGRTALHVLGTEHFDLIVLDLGLPRVSGLDVLEEFRRGGGDVPVLIVTARDAKQDRLAGLDSGADDYLVKPFDIDELFARARALLRRRFGRTQVVPELGPLRLLPNQNAVLWHGQTLELTVRQFEVLQSLIEAQGAVVARRAIEQRLYPDGETADGNALEVFIHQLRRKLGQDAIVNVRGIGYRLNSHVNTLRRRLLFGLMAALTVYAFIAGVAIFSRINAAASELFDYQLTQTAANLPAKIEAQPELPDDGNPDNDILIQIWDGHGALIYPQNPTTRLPKIESLGFSTVVTGRRTWRVLSQEQIGRLVEVAQPVSYREILEKDLLLRAVLPFALLIPLLALMIWWIVGRELKPIQRITASVAGASPSSLQAIEETNLPGEIAPLVDAVNGLLGRLSGAIAAQRAFVADAAHELRSPLTALKLQLQLTERTRDPAAREISMRKVHERLERATHLVEQLLVLARNESILDESTLTSVDIVTLVYSVADEFEIRARTSGQHILLTVTPPADLVLGDAESIRAMIGNLIDNALRYSAPSPEVRVRIANQGEMVMVEIEDDGPGVPADQAERIFDRFYRVPEASSQGTGLGLSIVKEVARRNRARVSLHQTQGRGFGITVAFARYAATLSAKSAPEMAL